MATKLKKGDFSDRSKKSQCFAACIFKKKEFFDSDGKLVRDTMISEFLLRESDPSNVDDVTRVLDKCLGKTGKNQCETAFNVYECYFITRFGPQEHRDIVRACAREFKVPVDLSLKLKNGNFSERGKGAQCLTSCIFKKKNYFKDGKWNRTSYMKEIMSGVNEELKPKITKSVDKCFKIVGIDDCETTFKVAECIWNVKFGSERTQEYTKTCVDQNNITEAMANNFKIGNFSDRSQDLQCFAECLFKKQGFFAKNGNLKRDLIIGRLIQLEPDAPHLFAIARAVDKCIELTGETQCETAFKFYECYWTNRFVMSQIDEPTTRKSKKSMKKTTAAVA